MAFAGPARVAFRTHWSTSSSPLRLIKTSSKVSDEVAASDLESVAACVVGRAVTTMGRVGTGDGTKVGACVRASTRPFPRVDAGRDQRRA